MFYGIPIEEIGNLDIMRFRQGNEESVLPVLGYDIDEILEFSFTVKDLSLPVNNILLKVKCNIFSDAEILHRIRNHNSKLIAYPEKMIYTSLACKDHSRKIKNIDFLLAKIFH